MDKGYYATTMERKLHNPPLSQSTIKMDKGYYTKIRLKLKVSLKSVAIHNKNGQGLLLMPQNVQDAIDLSQSTIKMDKGYYTTFYED